MLVKDFDFHLPPGLIARHPAAERDASRLMLLDRRAGTVDEGRFRNIAAWLAPGDLLVLNDTRVIPARLFGHKESGGRVEIFLLRRVGGEGEQWSCLLRSSKGLREGRVITLAAGMTAIVRARLGDDSWRVEFCGAEPFDTWLELEGHIPLPPYLQRDDDEQDRERYQTVFAQSPGAVAAPTAGLHFTRELLAELEGMGIETARLTLHTGLGTFQPVRVERVEEHRIHTERYSLPEATVEAIRCAKARGGRVVAVGTTTARTLEYAAAGDGSLRAGEGEADIFIYPGYRFKVVDSLVTNFHLPESTLLMLVSAFAGRDYVIGAYREAVGRGFRFYSYGDAMLIL
ncbi:MAG: tRNA preQ1(34) S-adenosylmethionine ribosyltransferase-isomerase QueA [Deltaproteobacteria bacterium]|nr:tRNA preQ1(34) S-adenosylmethionine ribosyltransferase-isomerase QueA [Deltaproteobacteria bacterium]